MPCQPPLVAIYLGFVRYFTARPKYVLVKAINVLVALVILFVVPCVFNSQIAEFVYPKVVYSSLAPLAVVFPTAVGVWLSSKVEKAVRVFACFGIFKLILFQ